MKKLLYLLSFGVLFGTSAMIGCGNDDDSGPSIQEQQVNALLGTWAAGDNPMNVLQGENQGPGNWSAFTMTFTASQVTVAGESEEVDIFAFSSSSYEVSGNSADEFQVSIGEDALNIAITSPTTMTITFTLGDDNQAIGGRTQSVNGDWTFSLTRRQ